MKFGAQSEDASVFYNAILNIVGSDKNIASDILSVYFDNIEEDWKIKASYANCDITPEQAYYLYNKSFPKKIHPPIEIFANKVLCSSDAKSIPVTPNRENIQIAKAELGDLSAQDYIYVINYLCHADIPNANRDAFGKDDLIYSLMHRDFSPSRPCIVDVNHQVIPSVGVTLDAYYDFDEEAGAYGLVVYSTLFNWGPYKEYVSDLAQQLSENNAKFSMMCLPHFVECSLCGKIFNDPDDYCEHLANMAEWPDVKRMLRFPKFFANSIITQPRQPADKWARPLLVANKGENMCVECDKLKQELELANTKITELQASLADSESLKASVETLTSDKAALVAEKEQLEKSLSETSGALETKTSEYNELETAKKSIEEANSSLSASIVEKDVMIAELNKKLEDNKVEMRLASLMSKIDVGDQVEFVSNEARVRDDASWDSFVSLLVKHVVNDAHVDASLSLPKPSVSDGVLSNIKQALNR